MFVKDCRSMGFASVILNDVIDFSSDVNYLNSKDVDGCNEFLGGEVVV